MSMLAEPRRKQKWSLNPRGTDWANDDNKFGQKLMEKMGWSKGKGLGRTEQGMREHISPRFKDNSKGLGYKGKDDEWVKHYEGFEDVLAALNSEHNSAANSKTGSKCNSSANSDEELDQKNKKSLEARSKVSKSRVHYHKFTRGKDLSRYNKDDIACILGSKRAKKLAEAKTDEEPTTKVDEIGHVDNFNGVTTVKGCTMQDYFAQKMDALKRNLDRKPQKLETDNYTEESQEPTLRYGFGFDSGVEDEEKATTATLNIDERSAEEPTKKLERQSEEADKKKKKKKKKKLDQLDDIKVEESLENGRKFEGYTEVEEGKEDTRKKKRKQVKDKEDQLNDELGEHYNSHDTLLSECNTKSKKSKKNKKSMQLINSDEGNELIDSELTTLEDTNELQLKKKKKKAKSPTEEIYQNVKDDDLVVEEYTNKGKKKRKRKKEDIEYAAEEIDILENPKKKSKTKTDKLLDGDDIGKMDADGILSDMQLEKKKKKKKKKDKKHKKLDYFEKKMAALNKSALSELQTKENGEEGEEEPLLKPGFGSGLDIEYSNGSWKNGKVEKEKKHEKDDSKGTKKRKKKYALKDEEEERKEANEKLKLEENKDDVGENLPFELKVEENLSSESTKSVERKTTNDECTKYYAVSSNTLEELETNEKEGKRKKKKKKKRKEPLEDEMDEDKISEILSKPKPKLDEVESKSKVDYEMALESEVTEEKTRPSSKIKKSVPTSPYTNEAIVEDIKQFPKKEKKAKKGKKNLEEDVLQNKIEEISESNRKHKKKKKVKYEEMAEAQTIQQSVKSREKKKKFEYAESGEQTSKDNEEVMHDVVETTVENIDQCANTGEKKKKKRKKNCDEEDGSQENEVGEITESNTKHKEKRKTKNKEVVDASFEAQYIQHSVKSSKKKKKCRHNEEEQTIKQDKGQEDAEVEKKAEDEGVICASQFGEMGNFQQLAKIKVKENTIKSEHKDLEYEEETTKHDTETIPNVQENIEYRGKEREKKTKRKKVNNLEDTDKKGNDDGEVIGLSCDSQQIKKKKKKDKKRSHMETQSEEGNQVMYDAPEKCLKDSDEAKNKVSTETPEVQLDKTDIIPNDVKETREWLNLDVINFSESSAFPEEAESMEVRAKRRTKNMHEMLSKINASNKTLRSALKSFGKSLRSPGNTNMPSFQDSRTNENVSLDCEDENMRDADDGSSERQTAIQDGSLGSEQFDNSNKDSLGSEQFDNNNKDIGKKSGPRLSDTECKKVGRGRSRFNGSNRYMGNGRKFVRFGDQRNFNQRNYGYNTRHSEKSHGDMGLHRSFHTGMSARGARPFRSSYNRGSGRHKAKEVRRIEDYFKDEKEISSRVRAFKGANLWQYKGYKI